MQPLARSATWIVDLGSFALVYPTLRTPVTLNEVLQRLLLGVKGPAEARVATKLDDAGKNWISKSYKQVRPGVEDVV